VREALEKLKKYCAYQDRAESEVRQKLRSFALPPDEAEQIVNILKEEKYLDEERFVESFIRGKVNAKKWGREKIKAHLFSKGIPAVVIEEHLATIDNDQYRQNLRDTIVKWERTHALNHETVPKLYRHLLSKGYAWQDIKLSIETLLK